jgi:hypothetical protein
MQKVNIFPRDYNVKIPKIPLSLERARERGRETTFGFKMTEERKKFN